MGNDMLQEEVEKNILQEIIDKTSIDMKIHRFMGKWKTKIEFPLKKEECVVEMHADGTIKMTGDMVGKRHVHVEIDDGNISVEIYNREEDNCDEIEFIRFAEHNIPLCDPDCIEKAAKIIEQAGEDYD